MELVVIFGPPAVGSPDAGRHLHIDTVSLTAHDVAARIAAHFNLPRVPAR